MSTDPPWLDEAAVQIQDLLQDLGYTVGDDACDAVVRAVLAFAFAAQPRSISEAYPLAAPEDLRRYREMAVQSAEADPPALDEAEESVKRGLALDATPRQIAKAVGKITAQQPRKITGAMVDAAARSSWERENFVVCELSWDDVGENIKGPYRSDMRAALEAAEKARRE